MSSNMVLPICPVLLVLQFVGLGMVASMVDVTVELQAPKFVVHRHSADLRCEHNVEPGRLYKVVFFKDGHRIMQYVHGRDPPFELYNFTGANINLSKLSSTSITLENMDFQASGSYACEIALETPLYSKISKLHDITVIVRQKHRPKIKIKYRKFSSNEMLEASCQSAPAHPAPHLSWYINHVKVDESLTTPNGVSQHKHHHGMPLSVTNTSLHFPLTSLRLVPNQTVDVSCVGTIPSYATDADGYADIQNHTVNELSPLKTASGDVATFCRFQYTTPIFGATFLTPQNTQTHSGDINTVRLEPAPTQMPVKIIGSNPNCSAPLHSEKLRLLLILLAYHLSFTLVND